MKKTHNDGESALSQQFNDLHDELFGGDGKTVVCPCCGHASECDEYDIQHICPMCEYIFVVV